MGEDRRIITLSPETLQDIAFEVGRASMLPPTKHKADSARAGKAFVISRDLTMATNTWVSAILIPAAGSTRIQIFDAVLTPSTSQQIPFLCFFKGALPASVAEVTTDDSKPSNSDALSEFTPREIYVATQLNTAVPMSSQPMTYKGQSGLGEPGEGVALIVRALATDFGNLVQGMFTFREIIDPR